MKFNTDNLEKYRAELVQLYGEGEDLSSAFSRLNEITPIVYEFDDSEKLTWESLSPESKNRIFNRTILPLLNSVSPSSQGQEDLQNELKQAATTSAPKSMIDANSPSIKIVMAFLKSLLDKLKRLPGLLKDMLMSVRDVVLAILVLIVVAVLLYMIYLMIYHVHGQRFYVGHTEGKFDDFMKNHLNTIDALMVDLQSKAWVTQVSSLAPGAAASVAALHSAIARFASYFDPKSPKTRNKTLLMNLGLNRGKALLLYHKFFDPIRVVAKNGGFMGALFAYQLTDPIFRAGDGIITELVKDFYENVYSMIDEIRLQSRAASDALHSSLHARRGQAYETMPAEAFHAITKVHTLRLHCSTYFRTIRESYKTRQWKLGTIALNTNFLHIYWLPVVQDITAVRIPKLFMDWPRNFVLGIKNFFRSWMGLGQGIAKMPLTLAKMGQSLVGMPEVDIDAPSGQTSLGMDAENSENPGFKNDDDAVLGTNTKEKFENEEYTDEASEEEDVVEPFFGFLKGLISVGDFFLNLLKTAKMIAKLFSQIASNPIGVVFSFVIIILGTIVGFLLLMLWAIFTIPPFILYPMYLYVVWTVIIVFALKLAGYLAMLVILFLLFIPFWLLDMALGGAIVAMLRCENLPSIWFEGHSYASGNEYKRFLGCAVPCATRFRPSTGLCWRLPDYLPDYCPQQQIYRLHLARTVRSPYAFDTYSDNPKFQLKEKDQKVTTLLKAFQEKQTFLRTCADRLSGYDFINMHLCAGHKLIAETMKVRQDDLKKFRFVCSQTYCKYKRSTSKKDFVRGILMVDKPESERPMYCSSLTDDGDAYDVGNEMTLLRRTVFLLLIIVMIAILIISIMKVFGKKLKKAQGGGVMSMLENAMTGIQKAKEGLQKQTDSSGSAGDGGAAPPPAATPAPSTK